MKVLMTGGTGFVGRPLVASLLEAGDRVTVLSRNPARAATTLPARAEVRHWDPANGVTADMVNGFDAVIHLAGEGVADHRWSEERKRAIRESRTRTSRELVAAIAAQPADARPRALISASAIGIYGDRGDELLDETSEPGDGFLADVCKAWEREVFAAADLGVRTVAIRIGVVLGRGGGALAQMLPIFRLGVGGRVGSGQQWMSWIHLDDLVRLFEFALSNDKVRGRLNGVAPNPVTNREFTAALAAAVKRPAILPAPALALHLALGEMATIVLASQRVFPRATEQLGFRFGFETVDSALKDICRENAEVIEREQWLPRPTAEVFEFFSNARNLESITPPFLHFEVLNVDPQPLSQGSQIDYRLRLHGLPVRWQSRIDDWVPGRRFVDVQTHGPYALWEHTHEFEACEGGTLVRDRVRYRLPVAPIGPLVAGTFVAKDLDRIFDYRREKLKEIFEAHPAAQPA